MHLVNMIVNLLLGIRYFFTHVVLIPILLRDLQLVNVVLGIRYLISHCAPPSSSPSGLAVIIDKIVNAILPMPSSLLIFTQSNATVSQQLNIIHHMMDAALWCYK